MAKLYNEPQTLSNREALVTHNGTDAFITIYNEHYTGNNSLITLTADISGSNVRLRGAGLTPNLRVTMYRILLSDSESASSGDNVNVVAATNVSSTATTVDTFSTDDHTGAFYVLVGNNTTEGAASIQEVMVVTDGSDAYVGAGPIVSTKGTDQLEFTASLSGTTVSLKASSTSGSSTTVNAYRVHLLRGEAGASTSNTVLIDTAQTITGQKTFSSEVILNSISSSDSSAVTVNDNLKVSGLTTDNAFLINAGDGTIGETTTLTVDTASNFLGINQTSPEVTLHMTGEGANSAQIRMEQHNDTGDAPDVRTRKTRGTAAAPTKNNANDFIYRSNHQRYNGTSYDTVGQLAIDTNSGNADRFQLSLTVSEDGSSIDAAQAQFVIDGNNNGAITFNNAYTFPTTDGTAGQVLRTDGADTLSFGEPNLEIVNGLTAAASVALDPTLGGIQTITLGQDTTFTLSNWASGHRMTLMIDDGANRSVTWPTMQWAGGVAPTLATTGFNTIELWYVGSTLYGAFVGAMS